jgi:heme exporter protein D
MSEFLHMGGYAAYVWSAYGIALVILTINLVQPMLSHRELRKRLSRIHQEEQE